LQKFASGAFGAPQLMQKFPAGEGATEGEEAGSEVPGADKGVPGGGAMVFEAPAFPGRPAPSWKASVISFVPRRNSLKALPILRPISGSRLGPKISNATTIIIRIWMGWIPNIKVSFLQVIKLESFLKDGQKELGFISTRGWISTTNSRSKHQLAKYQ
jgi:hypothetical protein